MEALTVMDSRSSYKVHPRGENEFGQRLSSGPVSRTDVLSRLSALGYTELSPANKSATIETLVFREGFSSSSDAIEDSLRQDEADDHHNKPSAQHESGNSFQDYSRLVATNYSAADRSSSEGNETSMLMDVPGYMSTTERRRLLSADPVISQRTPSRSLRQSSSLCYDAPSSTGSRRPVQAFADESSASSVWTDALNHYGLGYDSLLDNPSLVCTNGEAMREMLDHKLTYQKDDHKKASAERYDAQSVQSTETEYQMLPPAMSPPGGQMPPEQLQQQIWWQQPGALGEPSDTRTALGLPTYSTPPLHASRAHSAAGAASGYSSPLTSVTATASPHSSAVAMRVLQPVDGRVALVHTNSGGGRSGNGGNRSTDNNLLGKDDAYLPMDPFSDTSCLSTHADNSTEKRLSRGSGSRTTEQSPRGRGLSTTDHTPTLSDVSCGTLSAMSLAASDDSESDDRQSSSIDISQDRLLLHVIKPSAAKAVALAGSDNSRAKTVISSPLLLVSATSAAAAIATDRPVVAVSRARAPGLAAPMTLAAPSASALVSSRLDHIEAMVMKALERRQPDMPDAVLQRSISETIRQMKPGVSPSKPAELVATVADGEPARSLAPPSVGSPATVTSCSGGDGKLNQAAGVTSLLSSRIDGHSLTSADSGASNHRAHIQPLKDLSLNLSLLPDRTLPAFPAFSSATHFLSEQLKCRAGEKTPGRAVHKAAHRDELPPTNLSDQENMPKPSHDGPANQNARAFDKGSLLHLQPYRPSGSRVFTYIAAHTVDDTLSMTTTVESTHTDSDDARPPFLPVDALGSRREPAHRAPGIYGTRRRKVVEQGQSSAVYQHRLPPYHPNTAGDSGREASEDDNQPEPVTSGESAKHGVTAADSHRQPPGSEQGSAEYAQNLRDRADALLRLKDQLGGHGTDLNAMDKTEPTIRGIKERAAEVLATTAGGELHITDSQKFALSGFGERPQVPSTMSGATRASAVACTPQPHLFSHVPIPEREASRSDDRHSSDDPHRRLHAVVFDGARERLLSSEFARYAAANDAAHIDDNPAAGGDRLPVRAVVTSSSSNSRAPVATDVPLQYDPRLPSRAASCRRLPDAGRLSNGRAVTSGKMAATIARGPAEHRPIGARLLGSAGAAGGAATDWMTKPGVSLVGSRRTQSLSPARSPKAKAGLSSRPVTLRSSSVSPSPPRARGNPLKRSPVSSVRSPTCSGRGINPTGGTKPGDRSPTRASTTSTSLRSKLADVIKDRQLTYRVLIDELTNAEDAHKRHLLSQAWHEINQKKKDESSLSDEKLERLCDLLRNPLRHLVTKGKDISNRTTPSSSDVNRPDRHLEALRSAVLQQKSANIQRPLMVDRDTSPVRKGAADDRDVETASAGEHDDDADDGQVAVDHSGRRSRDVFGKPLTTGKEDGGMHSTPATSFSNTARTAAGRPPVKPAVEGGGGLAARDMRTQAVQTSFAHHQSNAGMPSRELASAKDEDKQLSPQLLRARAPVSSLRSVGQQSWRHHRQDAIMWYQPFSRKNAEANTYEKARQHFNEHRGCSWFVPLGQPKPWKRSPVERRANRLGHEPWFPSATGMPATVVTGAHAHLREGSGNTASGGLFISAAERRLLHELDQARHDTGNRDVTSRIGGVGTKGVVQPDDSSTASSLQEGFARCKQEFISRSRERLRRVALRSEERAINSLHDAEREKLFGLRAPLTAAAGEKLPGTSRAAATATIAARPPLQSSLPGDVGARLDGPRVARQRRRQLGHFVLQPRRAAISKHEMYERTRRMCTELPEERQRDVTLRRRQECAAHRSRVRLFNKKVLHSVLRKASVVTKTRK